MEKGGSARSGRRTRLLGNRWCNGKGAGSFVIDIDDAADDDEGLILVSSSDEA